MKKRFNYFTVLFIVGVLIFSCGNDKEKQTEQREDSKKIQDSLNKIENIKTIQRLAEKYNAIYDWDTLSQYSIIFEDKFKNESRPLQIDEARVKDIIRSNNDIFCYLDNWNFVFKLKISEEQLKRLINNKNIKYVTSVIKINKVRKNLFSIYIDNEESDDRQVMIEMGYDNEYTVTGEMIDFEILK